MHAESSDRTETVLGDPKKESHWAGKPEQRLPRTERNVCYLTRVHAYRKVGGVR